jgi:hypothetical protein
LTVRTAVLIQPPGNVYVIVVLPTATPVATPVFRPMVAIAVLLLLHVPPASASDNEVVVPTQVFSVPLIAAGNGLMVTTAVV